MSGRAGAEGFDDLFSAFSSNAPSSSSEVVASVSEETPLLGERSSGRVSHRWSRRLPMLAGSIMVIAPLLFRAFYERVSSPEEIRTIFFDTTKQLKDHELCKTIYADEGVTQFIRGLTADIFVQARRLEQALGTGNTFLMAALVALSFSALLLILKILPKRYRIRRVQGVNFAFLIMVLGVVLVAAGFYFGMQEAVPFDFLFTKNQPVLSYLRSQLEQGVKAVNAGQGGSSPCIYPLSSADTAIQSISLTAINALFTATMPMIGYALIGGASIYSLLDVWVDRRKRQSYRKLIGSSGVPFLPSDLTIHYKTVTHRYSFWRKTTHYCISLRQGLEVAQRLFFQQSGSFAEGVHVSGSAWWFSHDSSVSTFLFGSGFRSDQIQDHQGWHSFNGHLPSAHWLNRYLTEMRGVFLAGIHRAEDEEGVDSESLLNQRTSVRELFNRFIVQPDDRDCRTASEAAAADRLGNRNIADPTGSPEISDEEV